MQIPATYKCSTAELVGTMACNYPNVEKEAEKHELEFTNTSGSKLKALRRGSQAHRR